MSMKRFIVTCISLLVLGASLFAQSDSVRYVKYSPDFKFTEGIYLNYTQVRKNKPIPKSRILTSIDYRRNDFFDRVLSSKRIYFYDDMGMRQEVSPEKIWGYSKNGSLYINQNDGFHRISIVGNICHFVADVTVYSNNYTDPYYFYNPYYYRMNQPMAATTEMRQFLLSFETGQVLEYTVGAVEVLLMKDPELYDEFANLRKKKKKQLKFMYMRKFNERNPLMLPVYEN